MILSIIMLILFMVQPYGVTVQKHLAKQRKHMNMDLILMILEDGQGKPTDKSKYVPFHLQN